MWPENKSALNNITVENAQKLIEHKFGKIVGLFHTKLDNWKVKDENTNADEAASGEEYVFKRESDMLVLEIIAEKAEQELKEHLREVANSNKSTILPYKDDYNRRKKLFADLLFSDNLVEAEISDLRRKIVSYFVG